MGAIQRDIEQSQAEAMELLVAHCFQNQMEPEKSVICRADAQGFRTLAQAFRDADNALYELPVEELTETFDKMLKKTQESLRHVQESARTLLADPAQLEALSAAHDEIVIEGSNNTNSKENMMTLMTFAEKSCLAADKALESVTKDELELMAEFSLNVAHKILPMGESLFKSLCENELHGCDESFDRSSRITIEEINDDVTLQTPDTKEKSAIRQYLSTMYHSTVKNAAERPYMAGALTAIGLPFSGLLIPVAGIVGVALLVEEYYPEYAKLTWTMLTNIVQMVRLWVLLFKISMKHCGSLLKQCFRSWYEYASEKGIVATGHEVVAGLYSLSSIIVSRIIEKSASYL